VSGPLASWCAHHSKAGPVGRAVLGQIALGCHHDGSNAYAPTWDELQHRTGYKRAAVAKALREIEGLEEVTPTTRGGGRGIATPYRVNVALCDPVDSCATCRILVNTQKENGPPDRPFTGGKGPRHARKGPPGRPTTETHTRTRSIETPNQRLARLANHPPA
jgi:hypothetical protein